MPPYSHGTKILPDGTIRFDRKVNLSNIEEAILNPAFNFGSFEVGAGIDGGLFDVDGGVHGSTERPMLKLERVKWDEFSD